MQVHGPSEITDRVEAHFNPGRGRPFAVLSIGRVDVHIYTEAECDQLAAAVAEAKRLLLTAASAPGHPFTRPGQVAPDRPAPDACMVCGQPESAHTGEGEGK